MMLQTDRQTNTQSYFVYIYIDFSELSYLFLNQRFSIFRNERNLTRLMKFCHTILLISNSRNIERNRFTMVVNNQTEKKHFFSCIIPWWMLYKNNVSLLLIILIIRERISNKLIKFSNYCLLKKVRNTYKKVHLLQK